VSRSLLALVAHEWTIHRVYAAVERPQRLVESGFDGVLATGDDDNQAPSTDLFVEISLAGIEQTYIAIPEPAARPFACRSKWCGRVLPPPQPTV
jgi:hypothetical protein